MINLIIILIFILINIIVNVKLYTSIMKKLKHINTDCFYTAHKINKIDKYFDPFRERKVCFVNDEDWEKINNSKH